MADGTAAEGAAGAKSGDLAERGVETGTSVESEGTETWAMPNGIAALMRVHGLVIGEIALIEATTSIEVAGVRAVSAGREAAEAGEGPEQVDPPG